MTARFLLWSIPSRSDRLNAHRMLSTIRSDVAITSRVVAATQSFDDLRSVLRRRHQDPHVNRFGDEALIAAFEQKRRNSGGPKLSDEQMIALRRDGVGLNVETDLYEMWRQCVARFHAARRIPAAVQLIVGGLHRESSDLHGAVATILDSDEPFRRFRRVAVERRIDLKQRVAREWAIANGLTLQQEIDTIERLIRADVDHQLSREPEEAFAKLSESMISKSRELAARAGRLNDARFTFYVFRCLQRIGAYAVHGRVQWRSEWLRGAKTNPRAIAGASTLQAELGALLQEHVFVFEAGHSGSKATATTYRLRFAIEFGDLTHREAASALRLILNAKNVPR